VSGLFWAAEAAVSLDIVVIDVGNDDDVRRSRFEFGDEVRGCC
jgi:hypothetical protein